MTADRKWMEQLGFDLEDKGSMVPLWVVVDDCGGERPASLAEIVLWTSLTAPPATIAPAGKALVPLVMTQAMRDVTDSDGWDWPDLLAAAESITEKQHAELSAAATIAPELDVTKILLNVVPGDDGEGLEIYAKSVDDVVALLTKQGERIEELEGRVAAPVAPANGWEHLKVYGYAPGDYMTRCHVCGAITNGVDKRAVTCRPCAEATHAKSKATPVAPAEPTHLHRADGTLSGMFIEPVASEAAAAAADLRNWFDFLPGHAQPTIERAVRMLETRP